MGNEKKLHFSGLTDAEVAASREQYGENVLRPAARRSWLTHLLSKFNDPIIKVLIIGAILAFLAGELIDGAGILSAVLIAALLAFFNEYRAEKEFSVLNQTSDNVECRAIRNGEFVAVMRRDLTVGDIVLIEQGEEVPADGVVLEEMNLQIDQSKLTGESDPAVKSIEDIESGDSAGAYPANVLLRGTVAVEGHGVMRLTAVGEATEIGKTAIAASIETEEEAPLNRQLNRLAKVISIFGFSVAFLVLIILFAMGYYEGKIPANPADWLSREVLAEVLDYFMVAVALIVMAIPEGLAMSVTLSLVYGARKMTRSNNLVRRIHACETIGAVTVICTDKTGTLTMNRMQLAAAEFAEPEALYVPIAINSTAELSTDGTVLGNPTEGALLLWLKSQQVDYAAKRKEVDIVKQWTFSTERKFMATEGKIAGKLYLWVKGAPEIVLARCKMDEKEKTSVLEAIKSYQKRGMRSLGFAAIENPSEGDDILEVAENLVWQGFAAISDPVRSDVPEAVSRCRHAGIGIKMVTGDNVETAREIGRQLGLIDDETDLVITGEEFAKLTDEEAAQAALKMKIMSRARPNDKLRLVKLLKEQGAIVAVTGDGTNDAPALNFADVGISMGKTGTAAAKEASDIILLDDSFASIAEGVMWGRSLYNNIRKFLIFQLTVNFVALSVAVIGPFVGVTLPLTVLQILWVNLIMDTFAALALATDPPSENVMDSPPRKNSEFIINGDMWSRIVSTGIFFVIVLVGLLIYMNAKNLGEDPRMQTIFFTVMVMLQFWNLFSVRCYGKSLNPLCGIFANRSFLLVAALILVMQIIIVGFGGDFFRTTPLGWCEWGIIIGGTFLVLPLNALLELLKRKISPSNVNSEE